MSFNNYKSNINKIYHNKKGVISLFHKPYDLMKPNNQNIRLQNEYPSTNNFRHTMVRTSEPDKNHLIEKKQATYLDLKMMVRFFLDKIKLNHNKTKFHYFINEKNCF